MTKPKIHAAVVVPECNPVMIWHGGNMKRLAHYIELKQAGFAAHPLFTRLEGLPPLTQVLPFAPKLTFWVMMFQDLQQITVRKLSASALAETARRHMAARAGQDRWLLAGLLALDGRPDVGKVFSQEHSNVRHLSYGLLSEVYRQQPDEERVAFLLALEAAGHVFLERVARYFHDSGVRKALRHLGLDDAQPQGEAAESLDAALARIGLDAPQHTQFLQLIDRCYAALHVILDEIEQSLADGPPVAAPEGAPSATQCAAMI